MTKKLRRALFSVAMGFGLLFLSITAVPAQSYWFESYKRAVDLIDQEKMDEAEPLLARLIEQRPQPEHSVRVPGNQFFNYVPYYQRGRIEYAQGHYAASFESLHISKAFGAIRLDRRARVNADRLLKSMPKTPTQEEEVPGRTSTPPSTAGR